MTTQEKHSHCLDTLAGLEKGARIAWTDHNGEAREDEVLSVGTKRITTLLTTVAFNVKDLRVVSTPESPVPAPEPPTPAPTPSLRDLSPQPGEWIQWTDERDQEHTDEIRGWDDEQITTARTRVPWTARNLRLAVGGSSSAERQALTQAEPEAREAMERAISSGEEIHARIPLDWIDESPFNPRKTFDGEKLAALAQNIQDAGLIDPLLVRPKGDDKCELVDGARRRRACQLAGLALVPVRIRVMDDDEADRIMFDTQEHREPLNPIDRAEALLELVAKHGSQRKAAAHLERVAKHLKMDQSAISRATAIARLPEAVKALGRANELSASHLERLVKWNDWPEICSAIAALAVKERTSVADLARRPMPFAEELRQQKLIHRVEEYNTAFPKAWLTGGEYGRIFVKGDGYQLWWCLEPKVFQRLQREAKAAEREREQARTQEALAAAGVADRGDLVQLHTLPHNSYTELSEKWQQTPSCDGKCDCRVQAWCQRRKKTVAICTNPEKLERLRLADKAAAAERRRTEGQDLLEQLFVDLQERSEFTTRDLLFISTGSASAEYYVKAADLLNVEAPDGFQNDPSRLSAVPLHEARNLMVMARALRDAEYYVNGWHSGTLARIEWHLGLEAPAAEKPTDE